MVTGRRVLHGIGVSAGVATGPVALLLDPVAAPADEPPADVVAAGERVRSALEEVATDLERQAGRLGGDSAAAAVLVANAMMARDPGLAQAVDEALAGGLGPATALAAAVEEYAAKFQAAGGYLAERVADLRDVRARATALLLGLPPPGVPQLSIPSILVARDLAPSQAATLDPALVLGVVTELGGPTSHTAILAAQLGIPAVVQLTGALGPTGLSAGSPVAVDGASGQVIANPSAADLAGFTARAARRSAVSSSTVGPGRTRDGHPVPLLANVGTLADARRAADTDVEGIGLLRTEFLFLDRDSAPTLQEQSDRYAQVLQGFGERRVFVRTLDAGADKPLPFADLGHEDNPALGRRGLRLSRALPELLDTQLAALAAAAAGTGGDLRVMAPMVATAEEADWFALTARAHGIPVVGVMLEVPAAALRAHQLLAGLDFASLGTNDLQQYAMAADRLEGGLGALLDPWQPAVLDLVAAACEGGRAVATPVGVCGEAAGDPALALVLVGLGASSLSMAPAKVRAVRAALAAHDLRACERLAVAARSAVTAAQAKESVLSQADPLLHELT